MVAVANRLKPMCQRQTASSAAAIRATRGPKSSRPSSQTATTDQRPATVIAIRSASTFGPSSAMKSA